MKSASTGFGDGEFIARATSKDASVPVSTSRRAPETLDKIRSRCAPLHSVWPTYILFQLDKRRRLSRLFCVILCNRYFSIDVLKVQIALSKWSGFNKVKNLRPHVFHRKARRKPFLFSTRATLLPLTAPSVKLSFPKHICIFWTRGKDFLPQHIRAPPAAGPLCFLSSPDISLESFCSASSPFACLRPGGFTITEKKQNKKTFIPKLKAPSVCFSTLQCTAAVSNKPQRNHNGTLMDLRLVWKTQLGSKLVASSESVVI